MFLPRNIDLNQLADMALSVDPPWTVEVKLILMFLCLFKIPKQSGSRSLVARFVLYFLSQLYPSGRLRRTSSMES